MFNCAIFAYILLSIGHDDVIKWKYFFVLLGLCAGNSPDTGEFTAQKLVTRSFDVSFDLRLNKRLRKQSWGWWFETPSHSLWRYCNGYLMNDVSWCRAWCQPHCDPHVSARCVVTLHADFVKKVKDISLNDESLPIFIQIPVNIYHGYATREVLVNSTSLYETN